MREFSPAVTAQLTRKHGLETTLFIGVKWNGEREYLYSSNGATGTQKAIVNVSGLETTQRVEGTGASQSVTVTLSDTSGEVRAFLDSNDIHKQPAKVYLGFGDTPVRDSVVLIDGEVNSEMVWNDRAREFTFSILSKIEGRLFGFAVEDGLFVNVDPRSRSKPWPFRFGETCAYPAVEIRNGISGILRLGQGVVDSTLDAKICQAQKINCPLIEDPLASANEPSNDDNPALATNAWNQAVAQDPFGSDVGIQSPFGTRLSRPTTINGDTSSTGLANPANGQPLIRDKECEREKFRTLCQLLRDRANQLVFVNPVLLILGGEDFPQLTPVTIRIDDVLYEGEFDGEVFTISGETRADAPDQPDCANVGPLTQGYRQSNEDEPTSLAECQEPTEAWQLDVVGGPVEAWERLGQMAESEFKWLPAGSTVTLESTATRVNIVSLVPGTVTGVYAYRVLGDQRLLTALPTDYYEVMVTDYGDLEAVELWLPRSLGSYFGENWSEQIYVDFESDVGPNPVDVIEWIVERYTDFTIDATNFAEVKALLANYPCNYYHATKTNVLQVLNQIAFEARCALFVTDNVVKLSYLPEDPDVDKTFTSADLVAGSFSFSHSGTEELITNADVSWQPWGAENLASNQLVREFNVESNIQRYGFFGQSYVYSTINNEDQAVKTATFWSIRDSNTWRLAKFSTTLEHMNLELFDCIELNVPQFPNVKTVVSSVQVNPEQGTVEFECWTPVLSGTTEEFLWAWPANEAASEIYPTNDSAIPPPPIVVEPPVGHPLYIDPMSDADPPPPSIGDRFPSDNGDVFPVTICQDMTDPDLIDTLEPQFNRIGFASDTGEQADRAREVAGAGASFNFEEPEDNTVCGRPSLEDCVWEVNVQYGVATGVGWDQNTMSTGGTLESGCDPTPNGPCNATKGIRCSGPGGFFWCRTFGSELMGQAFADAIRGQINAAYCSWGKGQTGPVSVTGPTKRATDPNCVGMGNSEQGNEANNAGENPPSN